MMIVGMPGISDVQNRSFFSLWCMMAAPLIAGNDLRSMSEAAVETLTNLEAIAIDQDPLGIQGKIVWTDGTISLWADKPLFDGSRAVLVFNQGRYPVQKRIAWTEIGLDAGGSLLCEKSLDARDIQARDRRLHRQCRTRRGGIPPDLGEERFSCPAHYCGRFLPCVPQVNRSGAAKADRLDNGYEQGKLRARALESGGGAARPGSPSR